MNPTTKIAIWIVTAIKVVMLGYIALIGEINMLAQIVLLPLLLLEAFALAAFAYEMPSRQKGKERRKSLATFLEGAHSSANNLSHTS